VEKKHQYHGRRKILHEIREDGKRIYLERRKEEILNYFISKSSNGRVEGYNVVIKLLKRISSGMRNTELYAKKIILGLSP